MAFCSPREGPACSGWLVQAAPSQAHGLAESKVLDVPTGTSQHQSAGCGELELGWGWGEGSTAGTYSCCPPGAKAKGPTNQLSGGWCCTPSSIRSRPSHARPKLSRAWARRSAGSSAAEPAEDMTP